jgi:TM2 domain-containing membrane protein YozV
MHDYIDKATKNLTLDELARFALIFKERKKSEKKAFLLWLFGGAFGLHRFYTGNYGTGVILLGLTVFTLGLGSIIGFIDVLNLKRLVFNVNKGVVLEVVKEVKRK